MRLVEDRPGHDFRYSLNSSRLEALGWQPQYAFPQALAETVNWYVDNEHWWRPIKSGSYGEYYERNYAERSSTLASPGRRVGSTRHIDCEIQV